jgi:hypothetical protein
MNNLVIKVQNLTKILKDLKSRASWATKKKKTTKLLTQFGVAN